MEKRPLGKTGYEVSILGFGSAPIGYLNADQERASAILNLLFDSGVNLFDTGASYPGSEQMIGKALGHRRSEIVVVSKCGGKIPDLPEKMWTPELIAKTVDRSLKNLGMDHLDVMLLHSCDLKVLKDGGVIEPLVKAQEACDVAAAAGQTCTSPVTVAQEEAAQKILTALTNYEISQGITKGAAQ